MATIFVNPTRMELTKLKKRLKVARRGHKLLKDKRDELMKRFLEIVHKNKELRELVEQKLKNVYEGFLISRSLMTSESFETALMIPKQSISIELSYRNIMSVNVPVFDFNEESFNNANIYPYGFANTSGEMDSSIGSLSEVFPTMIKLAQMEKSARLLSYEIEKTRRRVNSLEYVLIPQLTDSIRFISMKLDEIERGNLTRLMKVKDMMVQQARNSQNY